MSRNAQPFPRLPRSLDSARDRRDPMADQDTKSAAAPAAAPPLPTLEEMQHWTWVMGRAQQMMLEHVARQAGEVKAPDPQALTNMWAHLGMLPDPAKLAQQQTDLWTQGTGTRERAPGARAPRQ